MLFPLALLCVLCGENVLGLGSSHKEVFVFSVLSAPCLTLAELQPGQSEAYRGDPTRCLVCGEKDRNLYPVAALGAPCDSLLVTGKTGARACHLPLSSSRIPEGVRDLGIDLGSIQIPRPFAPAEAAGTCPRNDKQCIAFTAHGLSSCLPPCFSAFPFTVHKVPQAPRQGTLFDLSSYALRVTSHAFLRYIILNAPTNSGGDLK